MDGSMPRCRVWMLPAATLGLMVGILLGRNADAWWPGCAVVALALLAMVGRGGKRTAALAMAAVGAGCLLGYRAYHPALPVEAAYHIRGTVVQEVALRDDGQVQTILQEVTLNGEAFPKGAYWTFYLDVEEALPEGLIPGAAVEMTAQVYHPDGQMNPGGFDFREYLLQRGVTIGLYGADELCISRSASLTGWIARVRHDLSLGLMDVMGPEHGAYAAAMLLGNRDFLADDDQAAFRKLGIAHILSVSGYHVGVLAALLLLIMKPLPLGRSARAGVTAILLAAYCLLTGGSAPVIRAALLLLWREVTRARHRQPLPLHMLCATACVQLICSPALLLSASFQLTYCAMLGLLLLAPGLRRLHTCRTAWGKRLWLAFCGALAAQIGILLPQLYWFGELPLLSLVLNMALMTLASSLMAAYWFTLAALPIPGLREVCGTVASGLTGLLLCGVRALASLDGVSLWTRRADCITALGYLVLMGSLSPLMPRKWIRHRRWMILLGVVLIASILIPLPGQGVTYTQFSVGDADAALLQDGDMAVLIDVGEDGRAAAGYLHQRRQGVDALILTHLHTDHAGGLRALLDQRIPVKTCYLPANALLTEPDEALLPLLDELAAAGTQMRPLSRGDIIRLPSGTFTVLWPGEGLTIPGQDANHFSLTLLADICGVTMLLTGDLTGQYEHYVQCPADILKVAHHGSTQSTSPSFLAAVSPDVLLLSNSSPARLARMEALRGDIPLYDTETCGAIRIHFLGNGQYEVVRYLPGESIGR